MTQPEALQLADKIEMSSNLSTNYQIRKQTAFELRRLHAELERCRKTCAATSECWRADADRWAAQRDALLSIYEVWAGSEGIPEPQTACEAYLLKLIEQMRDIARAAIAVVEDKA